MESSEFSWIFVDFRGARGWGYDSCVEIVVSQHWSHDRRRRQSAPSSFSTHSGGKSLSDLSTVLSLLRQFDPSHLPPL